jgi:hypothetical protein
VFVSVFTFENLNSSVSLDDSQVRSLCSSLLYGSSLPAAASLAGEADALFVAAFVMFGFARGAASVPGIRKKRIPGRLWVYVSLAMCVAGLGLEVGALALMIS